MKNLIQVLLYFSMPVFILQACNPVLYSNVGQNVPMLKSKGDFAGSLGYAISVGDNPTDGEGLSLQAAYAFSEKWGGILTFYTMSNMGAPEQDEWKSNGNYLELGGGRYGVLKNGKWAWEIYGGLGYYDINNKQEMNYCNVTIAKPFLQPSFGFTSRYFDAAITPRVGYLLYASKDYSRLSETPHYQIEQYFKDNNQKFVFEPGITLRGGFEQVKLQLQYNFSTFNVHYDDFYPVNDYFGSVSLFFMISDRHKSKK
ncbi:MAG: hypothetical protein MUE71_07885 [Chitinophagaceae bacterium]|nr:hypothetical protein [Chitinophagaceae bacterium]